MRQVVLSADGVDLHPEQASKLQGLGLIRFQNQAAIPSSELYQKYFSRI